MPDRVLRHAAAVVAAASCASGALADPIATGPVEAAVDNTFTLFVADTEFYDSNLFKVPSGSGPVVIVGSPSGSKSDEYNIGSVGTYVQRVVGRQTFDADLNLNETRFDHNTQLNNTSGNGQLLWNWEVGPYLSGQAGASYTRALAGFAETLYYGKDLVDTTSYFASGRYQIGPRWALLAEVQTDDTTHGAEAVAYNNFRDQTLSGGVEYAISAYDTVSLVYHHFEGRYPRLFIYNDAPFNRNYHEDFPQLYVKYAVSEKTSFDGNIGRILRSYDNVTVGQYTGIIWRAGVDYKFSDKLDLVVRGWHEIHAYSFSDSDFFVSKGASIAPRWNATDKLAFSVVLSTETDTYLPGSSSVQLFGSRRDKQNYEQFNVSYLPRDRWNLNLFVRHFERSSTQALVGFNDEFANIRLSYSFF